MRIEIDEDREEANSEREEKEQNHQQSPSRDSSSKSNDVFVTSRERAGEGSSSFATPIDPDTPSKTSAALRKRTLTEKNAVKIADIKQAAVDMKVRASGLWDTAKPRFSELYEVLWRLLEIHMMKVVFIAAMVVAVIDVS